MSTNTSGDTDSINSLTGTLPSSDNHHGDAEPDREQISGNVR